MFTLYIIVYATLVFYIMWPDIIGTYNEYNRDINRFQIETSGKAWECATGYKEWSKDHIQ